MTHPPAQPASGRSHNPWGDLRLRALSAAVLVPLALGCIWIGGWAFAGLLALIAAGLSREWLGLCGQPLGGQRLRGQRLCGHRPRGQRRSVAAWLLFAAVPAAVMVAQWDAAPHALIVLAAATLAAIALAGGLSAARPLAFGIPYIGLGAVALVWLRQASGSGCANVIALLCVIWASDIGAYLAGRAIGGRRMAPVISPGKTWSGAAGGLLAAGLTGWAAAVILAHPGTPWRPVGLALLIGLVSQAGDLFESLLKRHFGVKDSGAIIPGHGGLLDRLDAVLAAAPTAALLALLLGGGVGLWE